MSTNYSRTSTQIITRALRILGAIPQGGTPSTAAINEALEAHNIILKRLSNKGTVLTQAINVQVNPSTTTSEVIGTDGANYQCIKGHTSASTNQPVGTGATADWSLYWIKGGTSGGTWANATAYTSKRTFSLSADWDTVDKAIWQKDGTEYVLNLKTFADYLEVEDKMATASVPTDLAIEYTSSGMVGYLYPVPEAFTSAALKLSVAKLFLDEDSSATPELAATWLDYLTYQLAANLADEYSLPLQERAYLSSKAGELLTECLSSNTTYDAPRYVRGAF